MADTEPDFRTLATATPANLGPWLISEGFHAEGQVDVPGTFGRNQAASWAKGSVRVTVEDTSYVTLYVFDPIRPRAQIEKWEAHYSNAPLAAITAAVTTALATVAAALIPEE